MYLLTNVDAFVKRNFKVVLVFKILLILVISKISIKYWRLPNTPILYWGFVCSIIYLLRYLNFKNKRTNKILSIGAALLSLSVLTSYIVKNEFILKYKEFILFDFLCLFLSSWIFLNSIFTFFDWIINKKFVNNIHIAKTGIGNKKTFACIFLFIFLSWFPYFLTYYPGLIFGDSLSSIYQSMGIFNWNNHFPIAYSLFIKVCMKLGLILGSRNIGYAIYTLLQMLIISCTLSYIICWLRNKGIPMLFTIISCFYFAFEPCFAQHAISMWKDGIFSVLLIYLGIQLFDFVISEGEICENKRFYFKNILTSIIICLLRNNGVYIIAFICVCLGLYIITNKNNLRIKFRFFIYNLFVVAIILIITGPIYKSIGIDDDEVEKYGILLQQIARTVVEDGKINESDYEFLNTLLPINKYKELYDPQLVDPIKWDGDFNNSFLEENQREFIKTWLHLMPENLKTYIKAYLDMTYQYLSPNIWENNMYSGNIYAGNPDAPISYPHWAQAEVEYINLIENNWMNTKQVFSIATPMMAIGILVWIMVLVILYAFIKRKVTFLLSLTPCLGGLITLLIATPIGYWPRYMLSIYYMLPILICMIPMIGKAGKNVV